MLLIVTLLPGRQLSKMLECAEEAGLEALVEVKDEGELKRAVDAGVNAIGINARDLADFSVDLRRAEALVKRIATPTIKVAESGISKRQDLERLGEAGFHAVLVGTTLMRAEWPGQLLREWLAPTPAAGRSG